MPVLAAHASRLAERLQPLSLVLDAARPAVIDNGARRRTHLPGGSHPFWGGERSIGSADGASDQ